MIIHPKVLQNLIWQCVAKYILYSFTKLKILHSLIKTWKKTSAQEAYRIVTTGRNGYWGHSVNNMLLHPDDCNSKRRKLVKVPNKPFYQHVTLISQAKQMSMI